MTLILFFLLFTTSLLSVASDNLYVATQVRVESPGSLCNQLSEMQQDTCQSLIVSGKINSADIKVLRRMAGAEGSGSLRVLNLMDAEIVSSSEPYLTIQNAERYIIPRISIEKIQVLKNFPDGGMGMTEGELNHVNFILQNHPIEEQDKDFLSLKKEWKKAIRQRRKIKGHRITDNKNGHFTYSAFTCKNMFCEDMFYGCRFLSLVILPRKGKIYDRIVVDGDLVNYKKVAIMKQK